MTWTLHHGDCLDPVTGLAALADKSVDHVITDPPYEAEAHTKQRRVLYNGNRPRVEAAPLPFGAITEETRVALAQLAVRVARRWVVVFCQIEAVAIWRDTLEAAGARWRRGGIWDKGGTPQLTGDRPAQGCECLAIAWAGDGRSRWNGGGKSGVWKVGHQADGPDRMHPTQKPIGLMSALVRDFTDRGETILDPFAGSGTTGVAAIRAGRSFIGWELDAKYHETARRRLEETREQTSLLDVVTPRSEQLALLGK